MVLPLWVLEGPRSSSSGCLVPVGDSEDLWSDPLLSLVVGAPLCPETAGAQASLLPVSQQPSLPTSPPDPVSRGIPRPPRRAHSLLDGPPWRPGCLTRQTAVSWGQEQACRELGSSGHRKGAMPGRGPWQVQFLEEQASRDKFQPAHGLGGAAQCLPPRVTTLCCLCH